MNIFPWRATPAEREQSAAEKLASRAQRATELRTYQTNPDVQALMGERIRRALMVSQWLGITFCLVFTAVNVQKFVAGGVTEWSPEWLVAWIYDPMISIILVGVLLVEQYVTSHGHELDARAKAVKWFAFASTLILNCWTGLFPHGLAWWQDGNQVPNIAEVAKHAVPPVLAFLVCEASPGIHRLLTRIVGEVYAKGSAGDAPATLREVAPEAPLATPRATPVETVEATLGTAPVGPVATLVETRQETSHVSPGDAEGDVPSDWVEAMEKAMAEATRRQDSGDVEDTESGSSTKSPRVATETRKATPRRRKVTRRATTTETRKATPSLADLRSLLATRGDAVTVEYVVAAFGLSDASPETRRAISKQLYKARQAVASGDTEGTA